MMSNQFLVPRFKCGSSVNIAEQVRESERYSFSCLAKRNFNQSWFQILQDQKENHGWMHLWHFAPCC